MTVAVFENNNPAPEKNGQIIVGTAGGLRPEVVIFDNALAKISKRFFIDTRKIAGELGVAIGDFDGNKTKEIAVAYTVGQTKQIKIYTLAGKLVSQFKLSGTFTTGALKIGATDIDFDGKDEIVLMNGQ